MASVNKVILVASCGKDPELRYSANGAAICNVSLATNRSWKDKTSGDKVEEVEWHRVVFYDRLAEIAGEYLKKGKPCYVEGRLKTRKWTDKDGAEKYTTEIIAEQLQLLGGREGGDAAPAPAPAARPNQRRTPAPAPASRDGGGGSTGFDDMSDDIPYVQSMAGIHEEQTRRARRMRRYG